MQGMFQGASVFNGNVGGWITANSKVTNMANMFHTCHMFQGVGVNEWDTTSVSLMNGLFDHAYIFNADLSKWKTSKVTTTAQMFRQAKVFNADLSKVGLFFTF